MTERRVRRSRPYAVLIVALVLIVVLIAFLMAVMRYRTVFDPPADMIAVLTALFAVSGYVVGTYFGIKSSSDTTDEARGAVESVNALASQTAVTSPPEEAGQTPGEPPSQTTLGGDPEQEP